MHFFSLSLFLKINYEITGQILLRIIKWFITTKILKSTLIEGENLDDNG